uniref:Uncharacterized protein n=1 Tax=Fagus sylvatica TaxID=28930 RepID=A0A2N9FHT6_FAGSY
MVYVDTSEPFSLFFPPHAASPSHSHARRLSHRLKISSHGPDLSLPDSISRSQSQSLTLRLDQSQKLTVTAAFTLTVLPSQTHSLTVALSLSSLVLSPRELGASDSGGLGQVQRCLGV